MTQEIETTPSTATAPAAAKPRTRVEPTPRLPEGIALPEGYAPAYFRKRHGLLVLRAVDARNDYLVFSVKTGEYIKVKNTRESSKLMAAIGKGQESFSKAA
jgi:hypothetical protein